MPDAPTPTNAATDQANEPSRQDYEQWRDAKVRAALKRAETDQRYSQEDMWKTFGLEG